VRGRRRSVGVSVLREEPVQRHGSVREAVEREGDVLDDDGRPLFRTAPTDGNIPCRTFQSCACAAGSCVKRAGTRSEKPATAASAAISSPGRSASLFAWNSARRPAAPGGSV